MGGGFRLQSLWGRVKRVQLPDSLVKKSVSQSAGAGPEAANCLPDGRRLKGLEGLEGWLGSRTRLRGGWGPPLC